MNSVATNSSIIILSIIGLHPPFLTNFFSTDNKIAAFDCLIYDNSGEEITSAGVNVSGSN